MTSHSPEANVDGMDLRAIIMEVVAESQGVDTDAVDLDVKLEALDMESIDVVDIVCSLGKRGVNVTKEEIFALWNGQIPVTGALSHQNDDVGIRRRKPLEGKENEPLPEPTVADLVTAAHKKLAGVQVEQA